MPYEPESVTFVVKTFNRPKNCGITLGGIRNNWPGCRVILVDDGTEPAPDWLSGMADVYIPLPFDTGLSEGRNVGIRAADTPYVFIIDDDMHVSARLNIPGLVAGLGHFDIVSAYGGPLTMTRAGCRLTLTPGHRRIVDGVYHEADFVGQAMLCKRDVMLSLPYDPAIKICGEHLDFMVRAMEAGVRIGWTLESRCRSQPKRVTVEGYAEFRHRPQYHLATMVKHGLAHVRTPWGPLVRAPDGSLVAVHGHHLATPIKESDL